SGLGPGPSAGAWIGDHGQGLEARQRLAAASMHTSNGLATVSIKPKKKTPTRPITARAPAERASRRRSWSRHTSQVNVARTSPHSTIDPSSAAHAVATLNGKGVARAWLLPRYAKVKSSNRSAACRTAIEAKAPVSTIRTGVRRSVPGSPRLWATAVRAPANASHPAPTNDVSRAARPTKASITDSGAEG